jgi:hypothetical protein
VSERRLCKECGEPMTRFETSPCVRCVCKHVAEARQIVTEAKRQLALANHGSGR